MKNEICRRLTGVGNRLTENHFCSSARVRKILMEKHFRSGDGGGKIK